jgi:glutathione S-transferase
MDFYYAPGSSSQATHIMLHETALDFRPHKVDIFSHTLEDGSDYARINPNCYVPALVLADGTVLTECVAILDWLAGRAGAFSSGNEIVRRRHLQMLAFMSSELHKQFIPLFFAEDEEERTRLRQPLETRLNWIGTLLQGEHLLGDRFTGADAMLYVMLRWARRVGVAYPAGLNRFIESVERRDAVRSTLAAEGLEPLGAAA